MTALHQHTSLHQQVMSLSVGERRRGMRGTSDVMNAINLFPQHVGVACEGYEE